jgi:hypothetical protein
MGERKEKRQGRVMFKAALTLGDDHNKIALDILDIGRSVFGAERKRLLGIDVYKWAEGTQVIPLWAYHACAVYCQGKGWSPKTLDELIATYTTYCRLNDDGGVRGFCEFFEVSEIERGLLEKSLCETR